MTLSLDVLMAAIAETGREWQAGETSVSPYVGAPALDGNLFGLNIPDTEASNLLEQARGFELETFLAAVPPPAAIDWRNRGGKNYVTSVKYQSTCGACVAFATCACLESRLAIAQSQADPQVDLSEAHLFFCGCGACCRTGWNTSDALDWAVNGIADERQLRYDPRSQICPDPAPPPLVTVPGWKSAASAMARKQAIAENGPVIAGMRVYEDFYYYKSGIYRHVTGVFRGLHAVCVVGYDDDGGYWIVKNSWGPDWGEQGFFKIAYLQCDLDSTYPFYDPDVLPVSRAVS